MKSLIFFILAFLITPFSYAEEQANYNSSVIVYEETDGLDVLADIPLRISGFVQTIVGAGLFAGVSPFVGLMNTIPPHDSFDKTLEYLIIQPARYTFERPVGDYDFDSTKHNTHH